MTLETTDDLVVQRDTTLYSVQVGNVMANVQDTDLLVVCRNDTPYKITGEDFKGSLNPDIAPYIDTVTLTETDPGIAPRFTDQTFNVTVNMGVDGSPVSQKVIDAYVSGDLTKEFITDPITDVTDTPVSSTPVLFSATNAPCKSIATDGNGHWLAVNTDQLSQQSYNIGTGDIPVFGDTIPRPSFFSDGLYGVCGSTSGRFIMTGLQTSTRPQGSQICIGYSDDYGLTWTQSTIINSATVNRLDIYPTRSLTISTDDNGKWFIAGGDGAGSGAYSIISTDNGESFYITELNTNGANTPSCAGMSGDTLIMSANADNYYISTNGGSTWSAKIPDLGYGFQCVTGSKDGTILCSRQNTASQLAKFVNGVYVETINTPSTGFTSMVSLGSGNWLAASSTNIYSSSDNGSSWTESVPVGVYNPVTCNSVYANGVYVVVGNNPDTSAGGAYNSIKQGFTTVTVSGETNLSYIPDGTNVTNNLPTDDADYASGLVQEVVIDGANSSLKLSGGVGTWQVDQVVKTEPLKVQSSKLYLDFDSDGDVLSLSINKPSPSYVSTDNPVNLVLKFPTTFPTGIEPDTEFPEGTTLTVDVTATNRLASSSKSATILPIVIPTDPVQPEGSGVFITNLAGGYADSTISSPTTSPIIAGPFGSNGSNVFAITKDGNLIMFVPQFGTQTVMGPGYGQNIIDEGIITATAAYDGQHVVLTEAGNLHWYPASGGYECTTAANPTTSLIGENISGVTYYTNYSAQALAWSNDNKKLFSNCQLGNGIFVGKGWTGGTSSNFIDTTTLLSPVTFDLNSGVDIRQMVVLTPVATDNTIYDQLILFKDGKLFFSADNDVVEIDAGEGKTWKQIASTNIVSGPGAAVILDSTNTAFIWRLATSTATQLPGDWIYCPLGYAEDVSAISNVVGYNSLGVCTLGSSNQNLMPQSLPTINTSFDYKNLDLFLMNQAKFQKQQASFPSFPSVVSLMSPEQYAETALKFTTYKNREMVECGNNAEADRDDLIIKLQDAGYSIPDILSYL